MERKELHIMKVFFIMNLIMSILCCESIYNIQILMVIVTEV